MTWLEFKQEMERLGVEDSHTIHFLSNDDDIKEVQDIRRCLFTMSTEDPFWEVDLS